jgi:DNA-binding MarR family transcriptional regulator
MPDPRATNLLGAFLTGLHDHLGRQIEAASGLPGEGAAALVTIRYNEGCTVEFLRKVLGLSHSWTVRVVEKLQKDGLVEKRQGSDRRAVALHLTGAGARMVQGIVRSRRRCLDQVLQSLTAREQEHLTPLLERMLAVITVNADTAEAICRLCEVDVCPQGCCPVTQAVESG